MLARVRRALCALLAALALPASAHAAVDQLTIRDGQLRDAHGRRVVLHGVNVVYKLAPYLPDFTRADARRVRGWGMNAIRLGVSWRALEPARGAVDAGYVARLRKLVRLAGDEGLWVLVDMHQDVWSERYGGEGAPDWATLDDGQPFMPAPFPYGYLQPAVGRALTSFWTNRDSIRSEYVRAYAALAGALAHERAVIGYDAFNEPVCELALAPCALPPKPEAAAQYLEPFYRELVPALRRADSDSPTFYEDWLTTDFGYPFSVRAPSSGLGLSYHVYCGQPIRMDPCPTQERQALSQGVIAARVNHAAPLVTEFGATEKLGVLRRVADGADAAGVGWLYWQYKTYDDPTTSAASEGPDAESLVTPGGAVKAAKARTLARAYPQRIAGHDARWTYRASDGRFTLRWTAVRGADTVIALPALAYPHGFAVRAAGVRVVSRAPLTLRGTGRASITVTRRHA
jgi:endoglycosylceramidase